MLYFKHIKHMMIFPSTGAVNKAFLAQLGFICFATTVLVRILTRLFKLITKFVSPTYIISPNYLHWNALCAFFPFSGAR